jgi:hypothetical protein
LCACAKEIPVGFLSDNIVMREDTLSVVKGLYQVSGIPMVDGSTRPLHFEILRIKDLTTGQDAPEFSTNYPVKLWLSAFNPDTDSTVALVNEKLFYKDVPPLEINPVSGQLALNGGTTYINGTLYGVDVKVSNESTSRVYENFGILKLINQPWDVMNNVGEYFYGMVATDASPQNDIEIRNPLPSIEMEQVRANTHPRFSINKIADGDEVKIKLTFLDSNGEAFPGEAIAQWPSGASYLNCWFDNSLDTKMLTDGVEFNFPTVPFPAFGRVYVGTRESISLSYYVLHPAYYDLTPAARALANAKAAELGKTFTGHNLQVKITYQINEPGDWEVKVKFAYAIKK